MLCVTGEKLRACLTRAALVLCVSSVWVSTGSAVGQLTSEDIEALRRQGEIEGWTFEVGENAATARPMHTLYGLVIPEGWWKDARFDPCEPKRGLPESFDWRAEGGCTPIKNQSGCGACWAFATVGPLECNILIHDGIEEKLSEQWLVSCNSNGWSCDGGWWAHDYHEWKTDPCGDTGTVLDDDFHYVAWDAPCDCPYPHQLQYLIYDWAYVGSSASVPSVNSIKNAILQYGPVAAGVRVNSAFEAYNGGIFNSCVTGPTNHGIVLVGWDDTMGTDGCWILRNSWGHFWGDYGYMYIEYGCSSVGYAASYIDYLGPPPSGIDHQVVEVTITPEAIADDPGLENASTFDLQVIITEDDDWTSTGATATINGSFYQHPSFDSNVPQSGWWPSFPSLEFDSFFSARDFDAPAFAEGPTVTNDSMSAVWFDTVNTGNGTYTIGRFTVASGTTLTITGTSTANHTDGDLHAFDFEIQVGNDCPGDFDGDGYRGQSDLGILLAAYLIDAGGDMDGDGDTDQADLGAFLAVYDTPCP
ncbi:MAG: hypothetical protein KAS72_09950 [Phycisphaerales bacterium]|nr:hypothetical protein [Phycisphaerales bacterium]